MSLVTVYYDPVVTLGKFLQRTRFAEPHDDYLGLNEVRTIIKSENPTYWSDLVTEPMHRVVSDERFSKALVLLGYRLTPFRYISQEELVSIVTVEGLLRRCQVYKVFHDDLLQQERESVDLTGYLGDDEDVERVVSFNVRQFMGQRVDELLNSSEDFNFYLDWFCRYGIVIIGMTTVRW